MKTWQSAATVILVLAGCAALCLAQGTAGETPWLHKFTPVREIYVSPDGTGSGRAAAEPMSLGKAVEQAMPGDLIWLLEGTYKTGPFALRKAGTKDKPIVLRAMPGQRATVLGRIDVIGAYNWVWGLEVTDPQPADTGGDSLSARGPGVHLINNVVHDGWIGAGIGGWMNGPDHVYYGNIVWKVGQNKEAGARNYPIYTQSNFATEGYKYIVQNMFLDQRPDVGGPGYSFHGYTEGGFLSGFVLRQNIITRGRFVLGGSNEPHHHNTVEGNLFYDIPKIDIGYRRPIQVEFRDNYVGRTGLNIPFFWGVGVGTGAKPYTKPLPNIYTGNAIVNPPGGLAVTLRTSAYVGETRPDGQVPIDAKDVFDKNTYAGGFKANLFANGKQADLDLPGWQRESEAAGCAFDKNAKVVPAPTEPYVAVLANEYEPGRGHVAVFNWPKAAAVTVDLSPVLTKGATFRVVKAKDPFGKPVVEGKYDRPVTLGMGGEEFGAFLVLTTAPGAK